jgi:hypothetical protein
MGVHVNAVSVRRQHLAQGDALESKIRQFEKEAGQAARRIDSAATAGCQGLVVDRKSIAIALLNQQSADAKSSGQDVHPAN